MKHILGFANSGAGYIVIGYKEKPDRSLAPDQDITDKITASYEITRLCQYVEKYLVGQDRIKIEIYKEEFDGIRYPVISIARFHEYPFICTKDYVSPTTGEVILESGRIYIRTEGARTLVVKSPSELRQLIKECIKAKQEIEAKRPMEVGEEEWAELEEIPIEVGKYIKTPINKSSPKLEGEVKEAEKHFAAWVKDENNNAIEKMNSAGFNEGFYRFIIQVPYYLEKIDNSTLLDIARKSECHNTGWPIGVVMTKPEYEPVPLANGIRAIMIGKRSFMSNKDSFDYWSLNNRGHFFFIRNQEEDSESGEFSIENKLFWFDVAIWRISEILCYASNLCTEMNFKQSSYIELTISYEGIKDRLLSISSPLKSPFLEVRKCSVDKYEEHFRIQVANLMPKLKDNVYNITKRLFGCFHFYKPDRAVVDSIIDEFLNSRI